MGRLIDADALINTIVFHKDWALDVKEAIEEVINEEPSAEPEAIRCKDCKYKYVDGDNVKFNLCALNHNKVQSDDWYCADAEREENEDD